MRFQAVLPVFFAALCVFAAGSARADATQQAHRSAMSEPNRTANRSTDGYTIFPDWLFARPEFHEFLPGESNFDPQDQHSQQWQGQDWDPAAWDPAQWTPEIALKKFFEVRIFEKQYMDRGSMFSGRAQHASDAVPVLEVGPKFYQISDLDQRRALKLLADYTEVFKRGYALIQLRDWKTHDVIGHYTPKGMYLN